MDQQRVTCVLCDREVSGADLEKAYKVPHFSDVVICPPCMEAETYGHAKNAPFIREWLATRAAAPSAPSRA